VLRSLTAGSTDFRHDLGGSPVNDGLVPLESDLSSTLTLAREAVLARFDPGVDPHEVLPVVERQIREGHARGLLRIHEGGPVGIAVWEPAGPVGVAVRLFYLRPPFASSKGYREFLEAVGRTSGPIAFAPTLPGLSLEEETATWRSLGYAPYSRSEMRFPAAASVPAVEPSAGIVVRAFRPQDERALVALHAAAYRHHFDRYLFAEDLDPDRNAALTIRQLLQGAYGEFLPWASMVAEQEGRIVGETIVLAPPRRALIADVAVDPTAQGKGVGRAALVGTVRALRDRGISAIALVVTEGNRRAARLYEQLGFVRTLGPTREWYNTRRIPVGPSGP
jgi:ribosomal protein S18 acetylase RimI-like enzyme